MAARISRPPELLHGKRGRLAHDTVATSQGVHLATQRLNPDPVSDQKKSFSTPVFRPADGVSKRNMH